MFGAAQNMISYLGRPEPGENITVFPDSGGATTGNNFKGKTTGVLNRRVETEYTKKSESFFDKIDKL